MARKDTGKRATATAHAGNGGEAHQTASAPDARITTHHGVPVAENQNSLKAGRRGPTLLEDFIQREKIQHFDHERIPERIVRARGSAAHGMAMPLPPKSKAAVEPKDMKPSPVLRIVGKYPDTLKGRTIGVLVTDGADGALVKALREAVEGEGARMKIVAPKRQWDREP